MLLRHTWPRLFQILPSPRLSRRNSRISACCRCRGWTKLPVDAAEPRGVSRLAGKVHAYRQASGWQYNHQRGELVDYGSSLLYSVHGDGHSIAFSKHHKRRLTTYDADNDTIQRTGRHKYRHANSDHPTHSYSNNRHSLRIHCCFFYWYVLCCRAHSFINCCCVSLDDHGDSDFSCCREHLLNCHVIFFLLCVCFFTESVFTFFLLAFCQYYHCPYLLRPPTFIQLRNHPSEPLVVGYLLSWYVDVVSVVRWTGLASWLCVSQ